MQMLERLNQKLMQVGSPRTTRRTYARWAKSYFLFILRNYGRDIRPEQCGKKEIEAWLTEMAKAEYSPTTQNVALAAVLFVYKNLLGIEIDGVDALRSRKSTRIPTVLNMGELEKLLSGLHGVPLLTSKIQAACGLRIGEVCSLRIKDLDFERQQITVRAGKGAKDRITCFPDELHDAVRRQIDSMQVLFNHDRQGNMPGVSVPFAFDRKSPTASTSWPWFYLFASGNLSRHPDTKKLARHHVDSSNINRAIGDAARKVRIAKRVTSHTLRHTFATYMLSSGTDIQTLASMMGHGDIRTTQIYLHCNANSGVMKRSPFAELLANPAAVIRHREGATAQVRRFNVVG